MKILHVLFSDKKGGVEQSYIDYCCALRLGNNEVLPLVHTDFQYFEQLYETGALPPIKLRHFGRHNPLIKRRIKDIAIKNDIDVIIAHGNRSTALCRKASRLFPLVTVNHSTNISQVTKCDAVITVSNHIKDKVLQTIGNSINGRVFTIPNVVMVPKIHSFRKRKFHDPIVIGAMGRFESGKGFENFIKALALLKQEQIEFKAIIGGDGNKKLLQQLKHLANTLQLDDSIKFPGWITDKQRFFHNIDVFCLSSLYETFGIVILESFFHGVPVVAANCAGPKEIIKHKINGLLYEKDNINQLADCLKRVIKNESGSMLLAKQAYEDLRNNYSLSTMIKRLTHILQLVKPAQNTKQVTING